MHVVSNTIVSHFYSSIIYNFTCKFFICGHSAKSLCAGVCKIASLRTLRHEIVWEINMHWQECATIPIQAKGCDP